MQDSKEKDNFDIPSTLVDMGFIDENDIMNVLGEHLGMQVIHLSNEPIPLEVIDLLTLEICTQHQVIPVKLEETTVTVALADPFDMQAIEEVRSYLTENKYQVLFAIAPEQEVRSAIAKYYLGQEPGEELGSTSN